MQDYQYNTNGMSSSPEAEQWYEDMFARRQKVLLTSDYDEEEVEPEEGADECVEDSFDDKDEN